jgi:spermidine/putrescine transport system ATP-binding protein
VELSDNSAENVVSFQNVWKRYGEVIAASNLNLDVKSGEFLSFLGPSGCGKTTTLRMIAGFDQPSEGDVFLQGNRVNGVPAFKRPVNMVFQHYALFPHLNVADNVAYGLRQRSPKPADAEVQTRVTEALDLVQLGGYHKRRIWEMSGGQQQRVALARALINKPKVLLLDEPLAALDRKLRREMQIELQNLQRNVGITFILVTHDQEEALSMSDRVCIMREGAIVQVGSPRELYDNPLNRYIADFVGKSNFFDGVVQESSASELTVKLKDGDQLVIAKNRTRNPHAVGEQVILSIRPEQLILSRRIERLPAANAVTISAAIRNRIFLGEHTEYLLHNDQFGEFLALFPRQNEVDESPFDVNENIHISWNQEAALVLDYS